MCEILAYVGVMLFVLLLGLFMSGIIKTKHVVYICLFSVFVFIVAKSYYVWIIK